MHQIANHENLVFYQLESSDSELLQQVVELHNSTFPTSREIDADLAAKRAENGFTLVALDSADSNKLVSCISGLFASRDHILRSANWQEVTTNGSFSYSDREQECVLLTAVSSLGAVGRAPEINQSELRLIDEAQIRQYMDSGQDFVAKFHTKPKAGLQQGAVAIQLVPNGSPGDLASMGYVVIYEYPNLEQANLTFTSTKPGLAIVEAAMMFAKQNQKYEVLAYSRFGELYKLALV